MSNNLNSQLELIEDNPEVTSYIYQQLSEFEPYISPNTVFAVIAKDPTKLANRFESEGAHFDKASLRKMFRISMSLTENGTTLEAEGLSTDIFSAIKMAREKLSKHLQQIHDDMVSNKEREKEIDNVINSAAPHILH